MSENSEMCGKKWTIEEEEKLLKYIREGKKYENIAKEHKRTIGGIISKFKGIVKTRINNGDTVKKISKDINISEHILNDILKGTIIEERIDNNSNCSSLLSQIIEKKSDNKIENKNNLFVHNELKCLKEKNILIIDVETTGISNTEKEKIPAYKLYKSFEETDIYNDINIVQIGWCYIEKFNIANINDYNIKSEIRKPLNFLIPEESIKFHGIDNEKAKNEGIKFSKILNDNDFYGMIEKCDYIIAHNAEYDYNVLMSEIKKIGYNDLYKLLLESKNKIICTYKGTNGRYSLKRLYNVTFGCDFNNEHTADGDVKALLEIISGRLSTIKLKKEIEKEKIKIEYYEIIEKMLNQNSDETKKCLKKIKNIMKECDN